MEDGDCFEQLSAAMTRHTGDEGSARLKESVSCLHRGWNTSCSGITTTARCGCVSGLFQWNRKNIYPIWHGAINGSTKDSLQCILCFFFLLSSRNQWAHPRKWINRSDFCLSRKGERCSWLICCKSKGFTKLPAVFVLFFALTLNLRVDLQCQVWCNNFTGRIDWLFLLFPNAEEGMWGRVTSSISTNNHLANQETARGPWILTALMAELHMIQQGWTHLKCRNAAW